MLYHLLTPLADQISFLNVFTYITFRASGATVTAILLAMVIGPRVIRRLRDGGIGQVVRADGPASHHEKRGTPTMGGLIILMSTVGPTLLWARLDTRFVLIACVATLWMGAIGFLDDYLKVVHGKPRGLIAQYKLIGQVTFGAALATYLMVWPPHVGSLAPTETTLPFLKHYAILLPPLVYMVLVTVVVTGASNSVNLTDGLDGLAAGLTVIAAGALAIFTYVSGNANAAGYLLISFLPGSGELTIFCASLMGAALGFLWFNSHPAEVFMGDTGALAIGGALGTVCILIKSEYVFLFVGGVFVAETLSVMVQTGTFRWRRKRYGLEYAKANRVFRMAPLHHHFEKLGWAESKVVTRFYIIGILCALFAVATLKLR